MHPEIHTESHVDTFVINDIVLSIPPESIQVQKEDIQYQWKTLRSKVSTKSVSSHGQNIVNISTAFKASSILELHRLIIELRNSPFCFVENIFLRETFVPTWNYSQKMAFSVFDFTVSPYPNSSDTFSVNIKLVWFNYFPYLHNWLYRRDWKTDWIQVGSARHKRTIGWDVDEKGKYKNSYLNILDFEETSIPAEKKKLEAEMFGTLYDLLPLPGNMEKSTYVSDPRESLIYKRYINFLQRDALLKDFGIDIITDVQDIPALHDILFSTHKTNFSDYVLSLHDSIWYSKYQIEDFSDAQERFTNLQKQWTENILKYRDDIGIQFYIYQTVTIPDIMEKQYSNIVNNVAVDLSTSNGGWLYNPSNTKKFGYRTQISNPGGFHSPFGDENGPISFGALPISDSFKWRDDDRYDKGQGERIHWGIDMGIKDKTGEFFYAMKDGIVERIEDYYSTNTSGIWYKIIMSKGKEKKVAVTSADDLDLSIKYAFFPRKEKMSFADQKDIITNVFGADSLITNGNKLTTAALNNSFVKSNIRVGLLIRSNADSNTYYLYDAKNSAGAVLVIKHDDGSYSEYYHWESLYVTQDNKVKAGDKLGIIGRKSTVEVNGAIGEYDEVGHRIFLTGTDVKEHLHVEYWEPYNQNIQANPQNADPAEVVTKDGRKDYILVDWLNYARKTWPGYTQIPSTDTSLEQVNEVTQHMSNHLEDDKKKKVQSALETITKLINDGWYYYNDSSDVTNVWYKPVRWSISRNNPDALLEDVLENQDLIFANFVGGFKNLISTIPILDHEFPTHQFLGSTEPFYLFEFFALDKRIPADNLTGMNEGIGNGAKILETIRQTLLRNAARFRRIPNSWTLRIDTFITRLLGTTSHFDIEGYQDDEGLNHYDVVRKSSISRMDSNTVLDSPGLVSIVLETSETNTFDQELLVNEGITKQELNNSLVKVLNALYNLDLGIDPKLIQILALASLMEKDIDIFSNQEFVLGGLENGQVTATNSNFSTENIDFLNSFSLLEDKQLFTYTQDGIHKSDTEDGLRTTDELLVSTIDVVTFPYNDAYMRIINGNKVVLDFQALRTALTDTDLYNGKNIDLDLVLAMSTTVRKVVLSANLTIAEDYSEIASGELTGEPVSRSEVRTALYDLPIEPKFFRAISEYMIDIGVRSYWPFLDLIGYTPYSESKDISFTNKKSKVRNEIEANSNWLRFNSAGSFDHLVDLGYANSLFSMRNARSANNGILNLIIDYTAIPTDYVWRQITEQPRAAKEVLEKWLNDKDDQALISSYGKYLESTTSDVMDKVARDYILSLPMWEEGARDFITYAGMDWASHVFGPVFDLFTTNSSAFQETSSSIKDIFLSGGYIVGHPLFSTMSYYVTPFQDTVQDNEIVTETSTNESGGVSTFDEYALFAAGRIPVLNDVFEWVLSPFIDERSVIQQAKLNPSGSRLVWSVNKDNELRKISVYKNALARIGMEALKNPGVLRILGMEDLEYHETADVVKGREAYPDLNLPAHPYFGDKYSTYPDFYMWNMYEDGDIHNSAVREQIEKVMFVSLTNAYNSIQKFKAADTGQKTDTGPKEEGKTDSSVILNLQYQAEGSDGMATPYYLTEESELDISEWMSNTQSSNGVSINTKTGESYQEYASTDVDPRISRNNPKGVRLSNTEGVNGANGGILHPKRATEEKYSELKTTFEGIQSGQMFGSRAGYLDIDDRNITENDRIDGLPISIQVQPTHAFDLESLKLLARQSSYDLFSQKRRLARGYPTFKLYFVEEDEAESRLLNFDDFYSYSGVKDFTIVASSKSPADHAVITLQNVSGALDGTKRNAVVDADYFINYKKDRADIPENIGTVDEQSFGSLILRPGLNVQLRCGYSNNPDLLEVMISGRIVDIQWSIGGDLAQITVQSFGTELTQILKNSNTNADIEPIYTTHQLLSTLMLEPELMHFGRWEFGKLFQYGQAKDARLDFYDYSRDAKGGFFNYANKAFEWTLSHPYLLLAAMIGIQLVQLAPTGKGAVGAGSKFLRNLTKPIEWLGGFRILRPIFEAINIGAELDNTTIVKRVIIGLDDKLKTKDWFKTVYRHSKQFLTKDQTDLPIDQLDEIIKTMRGEGDLLLEENYGQFKRILTKIIHHNKTNESAINTLADEIHTAAKKKIAASTTLEEVSEAVVEAQDELMALRFRTVWYSDPIAAAKDGANPLSGIGGQPLARILRSSIQTSLLMAGTIAGGGSLDIASLLFKGNDKGPIDAILNYFEASKVSLFLSPQDDNLFPPHPKDYMLTGQSVFDKLYRKFTKFGISILPGIDPGGVVDRWINGVDPFNKRVPVKDCGYILQNVFIWDVFQEMTLRHPGWIAAVRPYGTSFRYTTFFGIPSQRYWSHDMSNRFVDRANTLYEFLSDGITEDRYRSLYGSTLEDGSSIYDLKLEIEYELTTGKVVDAKAALEERLATRVVKEYLTGLNYRFVPFRRYHLISSETDIVHNGLLVSENASYNAVDITYFPDEGEEPEGSLLFKVHPFIPEHSLRVKPVRPYSNCRGLIMASRYGMGELMKTMKDIYRGEIIILGNSRIKPYDVGILLDNYNDMVGPIEIDQVVTNFSYETGFITEIKPAAFVVANETSSWPVLEAIKVASLAIKNIEYDAFGMTNFLEDDVINPTNMFLTHGTSAHFDKEEEYLKRKLQAALGSSVSIRDDGGLSVVSPLGDKPFSFGDSLIGEALDLASDLNDIPPPLLPYILYDLTDLPEILPSFPGLVNLVGGYSIFLQCLKGDSIQVIPLIKNGRPIVANLTVQDPSVLWSNFKGSLARVIDDYVDGTRDLTSLWKTYGSYMWRLPEWQFLNYTDSSQNITNNVNMTGQ